MVWKLILVTGFLLFLYSFWVLVGIRFDALSEFGHGYFWGHIIRSSIGLGLVLVGMIGMRRNKKG